MVEKTVNNFSDREIVITRIIDAPRELVWEAWTDPKHLEKWWGPDGFSTNTKEFDFKVGGIWSHVMKGPDGTLYPNESTFEEIIRPEKITYTHGGGKEGTDDAQFEATVTFEDLDGKTILTMRSVFASVAERDHVVKVYGAIEGGNQTLGRLADYVAQIPIVMEQIYDAPVAVVWQALTDADQMRKWYMPALKDFKPEIGFETEFTVHHEGVDYPHIWKITEVEVGRKISYLWLFGGNPGTSVVTFELTPVGDKTKLFFTHRGVESFNPQKNPGLSRDNFMMGWNDLLHNLLKNFVENNSK